MDAVESGSHANGPHADWSAAAPADWSNWTEPASGPWNDSEPHHEMVLLAYPTDYRVIATILQALIFLAGVAGNIIVIVVISKTKSLQSPTYTYLISLAVADLIVLVSAVPEAIVVHHIGKRWLAGQVGCSLFIFSNFLGINAGSLNILAFTVEQYVAVMCSGGRWRAVFSRHSRIVVAVVWLFSVLYCAPWLVLTEVRQETEFPFREQCELRLSREQYLGLFGADFLLFYVIPLLVAVLAYTRIALFMLTGPRACPWDSPLASRGSLTHPDAAAAGLFGLPAPVPPIFRPPGTPSTPTSIAARHTAVEPLLVAAARKKLLAHENTLVRASGSAATFTQQRKYVTPQSRKQVLRMLVIIVVLFAVAWLPFRGLLIYNSFASEPWMDIWYLFAAKTLIYFNSAMNPILYNVMSRRFRLAFNRIVLCKYNAAVKRRIKRMNNNSKNSTASRSHVGQDALLLYA
ncbi:thyrotropin-releasing hormone receptor-like [Paramacrobiotus metropolitanus]|uniref:thyrotropin-releasing hormone receptor-like n=1 Tax=Paramacrobiotus metropolitanus TaxID=2943436 RepID=UPI002445A6AD|nr:thyrotropin-releasing hormone receptor-like [Paramacrobiotus metropolitanus]